MKESITDCIEETNQQLHKCQTKQTDQERLKNHVQRRIRESKQSQQKKLEETPTDLEALLPILRELLDGDVHSFIIALRTRDGITLTHKSRNSEKLMEALDGKP